MGVYLRDRSMLSKRRIPGFSITEALLAATLASLVALMALNILPSAMRGLATSAEELQASDLASETMSRLESMGFEKLVEGSWDGRLPTPAEGEGTPDRFPPPPYPSVQRQFVEGQRERRVDYQVQVVVGPGRDRDGNVAADLKTVTVTVHWNEVRANTSKPRSLTVGTLVVDP